MVAVSVVMPQTAEASSTPKIEATSTKAELQALAVVIAKEKGVSAELLSTIVSRESQWNEKAVGDMGISCPTTGKPVRARGLMQITECYHGEISDDEAFDAEFALNWGAKKLKEGQCKKEFSTCRNLESLPY